RLQFVVTTKQYARWGALYQFFLDSLRKDVIG
ncbi:MAG: hypothetical protein K1000chlam3_00824, partial [Chlamydiae bacterium]|nr:hypothetical protein [Chlamydiota bacterium]